MAIGRGDLMTLNRLITTLVQLMLAVPAVFGIRAIYQDFKSGDFWRDLIHEE